MKWQDLQKLLAKARRENKVIVFNFSETELHYAHRTWIVINELKKTEEK